MDDLVDFSGIPFGTISEPGPLGDSWFVTCGRQQDPAEFDITKTVSASGPCLEVSIRKTVRWLRVEQELDKTQLDAGHLRLRMRYAAESEIVGREGSVATVSLYGYVNNFGERHTTFQARLEPSAHINEIDCVVRLEAPLEADKDYRFTIGFEKAARVRIYSLALETLSEESYYRNMLEIARKPRGALPDGRMAPAPYRVGKFPVSDKLAVLNDQMDKRLRADPLQWQQDMLGVALRLEDYPTAGGLVRHILHRHDPSPAKWAELLPLILDHCVATGDLQTLTDLWLRLARAPETRDLAQTIVALIAPDDLPQTGTLAVDLYPANQKMRTAPEAVGLNRVAGILSGKAQDHLLLANHFRNRDPARQAAAIEAYFASFDLPMLPRIDMSQPNVLAGTTFVPRQPEAAAPLTSGLHGTPLVSVIVAAYNCETTLAYAVNSILGQTYENIEVLVADDASTDGTAAAMQAFADHPRVRLFQSIANQGPYNIRNALIAEAKGDYITFHDSDDLALPHRVATQLDDLRKHDALLSVGRWLRITPDGHFIAFRDGQFLRMCVNSIMFHRAVYEAWGPYRSVLFGADSEFYLSARGYLGADKIRQVEVPCVLGLWSDSSLTRTSGIEADESGYRSDKRRCYAALAGRQRILGKSILPDEEMARILDENGISRVAHGVRPLPAAKQKKAV